MWFIRLTCIEYDWLKSKINKECDKNTQYVCIV
jgi:hypothetical protein